MSEKFLETGSVEVLLLSACPSRTSLNAHLIALHITSAWQVISLELGFLLFTKNCTKEWAVLNFKRKIKSSI